MSDATEVAPDAPATDAPTAEPTKPRRLHVTVIRAERNGWIAYVTGTQYLLGPRHVSSTEALRWIRKRRWTIAVDIMVLDENGETIRTLTLPTPKPTP